MKREKNSFSGGGDSSGTIGLTGIGLNQNYKDQKGQKDHHDQKCTLSLAKKVLGQGISSSPPPAVHLPFHEMPERMPEQMPERMSEQKRELNEQQDFHSLAEQMAKLKDIEQRTRYLLKEINLYISSRSEEEV